MSSVSTASTYINNLLLSRGLLRNGTPIAFAELEALERKYDSKHGGKAGEEAKKMEGTTAAAMTLVHDLVLRRDREAETLLTLSGSLSSLRGTASAQQATIARLEARAADLERQLALATAQKEAAKITQKKAEATVIGLKVEGARLKVTVGQVREQCKGDVRRRDGEIQRLKKHLDGRRGRDGGVVGVTVVGRGQKRGTDATRGEGIVDVGSADYSLGQETNEFLAELSRGLSEENEGLARLVRGAVETLRRLLGEEKHGEVADGNVIVMTPPSYEESVADMEEVMGRLRELLTNPSFVPIEEVEIREDEIIRLREGWERMEGRWREAVELMDGWRKRMVETGDTINLEDLKRGMDLGSGIRAEPKESAYNDLSLGIDDDHEDILLEELDSEETQEVTLRPEALGSLPAKDQSPIRNGRMDGAIFPASTVLSPSSGNSRPLVSPQKVSFDMDVSEEQDSFKKQEGPEKVALLEFSDIELLPPTKKTRSRIPRQTNAMQTEQLTVQEKLERAQEEAEETRLHESEADRRQNVLRKVGARSSRRRSTLSPEELENLMGVA